MTNPNDKKIQGTLSKVIEIDVYMGRCIYINDYRVVGSKPYVDEDFEKYVTKCKLFDLLESIDFGDIENFVEYKKSLL